MNLSTSLPLVCALSSLVAFPGCVTSISPAPNDDCADLANQGCVVTSTAQRLEAPVASPADVDAAVRGNTSFALDLYRELAASPGNLFFSPFSISESLAMTWAGARGETEAQIARALHLDLSQIKLHPALHALERGIEQRAGSGVDAHLTIAHALWGQQGYPVSTPFLDTLAQSYGAGLHVVDFAGAPEEARATINSWMTESSGKEIKDLLAPGSISSTTRLVISNAVYFKAAWKTPFKRADSRLERFTRRDGVSLEVPTMTATQPLAYGAGPDYAAVQLPYSDGDLSMVLVLPTAGRLDAVEASLTPDRLTSILAGFGRRTVTISLPRFKIDSAFTLQAPLAHLGMPVAFTSEADFSGINGRRDIALGAVLHEAFVDVDEAGTEAAAATATGFTATAAFLPAEIRFERPYLFLVRDNVTGTVLFLGRVDDPTP